MGKGAITTKISVHITREKVRMKHKRAHFGDVMTILDARMREAH